MILLQLIPLPHLSFVDVAFAIFSNLLLFLLQSARVHPGEHHGLLHGAPWPHTGQELDKSCPERRRKESIEDRVDTGVTVGQHVGPNLEKILCTEK